MNIGKRSTVPHRPGSDGIIRTAFFENGICFRAEVSKRAAAHRFHNDDRNSFFGENFVLGFGVLVVPVKVVELDLGEFPAVVIINDFLQYFWRVVERETNVANLTSRFAFLQFVQDFEIFHAFESPGIKSVNQVKIKVAGAGFFKLFVKDFVYGSLRNFRHKTDREFCGKIVTFAGITGERFFDKFFGFAAVIAVSGVKIIDAVLISVIDHLKCFFTVDLSVCSGREPHAAESQAGNFNSHFFKQFLLHSILHLLLCHLPVF